MIETPKKLIGKTLAEAGIRPNFMITVVVIRRTVLDEKTHEAGTTVIALPGGDEVLNEGDILGVIGEEADIEKFR
jgi:K+/H+ antiporter YhaU regulatory subunit KhtT